MQRHYDITEWIDLLRGLMEPDRRAALENHRQECARCSDTAVLVEHLLSTAASDRQGGNVPAQVVHNARAIFALRGLDQVQLRPGSIARLVFDSFNQPALQGVRSEQRSDIRHMLYDVDGYVIDLQLEHERGVPAVSMIGQIHHASDSGDPVARMPVTLRSGEETVATTISNQFGEFALEYLPQSSLCLHLGVEGNPGKEA